MRVACSAHDVNGVPDNKELRLSVHPRTTTVGHRRQHTKATMNSPRLAREWSRCTSFPAGALQPRVAIFTLSGVLLREALIRSPTTAK